MTTANMCLKFDILLYFGGLELIMNVCLFQELIAALLACSFFCLFPDSHRGDKNLPIINFGHLFKYVATSVALSLPHLHSYVVARACDAYVLFY